MIQDHSDHGASKEPTNPLWSRIHRFLWCTMIQVILDHWSGSGSPQRNTPLVREKGRWEKGRCVLKICVWPKLHRSIRLFHCFVQNNYMALGHGNRFGTNNFGLTLSESALCKMHCYWFRCFIDRSIVHFQVLSSPSFCVLLAPKIFFFSWAQDFPRPFFSCGLLSRHARWTKGKKGPRISHGHYLQYDMSKKDFPCPVISLPFMSLPL